MLLLLYMVSRFGLGEEREGAIIVFNITYFYFRVTYKNAQLSLKFYQFGP